jgi:hypothetical protein
MIGIMWTGKARALVLAISVEGAAVLLAMAALVPYLKCTTKLIFSALTTKAPRSAPSSSLPVMAFAWRNLVPERQGGRANHADDSNSKDNCKGSCWSAAFSACLRAGAYPRHANRREASGRHRAANHAGALFPDRTGRISPSVITRRRLKFLGNRSVYARIFGLAMPGWWQPSPCAIEIRRRHRRLVHLSKFTNPISPAMVRAKEGS